MHSGKSCTILFLKLHNHVLTNWSSQTIPLENILWCYVSAGSGACGQPASSKPPQLQGLVGDQFLMHGPMLYLIMFYSKRTSLVRPLGSMGLRVRRQGREKKKVTVELFIYFAMESDCLMLAMGFGVSSIAMPAKPGLMRPAKDSVESNWCEQ